MDVWLVPRLGSVEEVDFENFTSFFLEAEGVTHSRVFFDILIGCGVYEYHCRILDAIVNRVSPREVAQAVMVPTTLALRSWVGDVGKELPRVEPVNLCPIGRTGP